MTDTPQELKDKEQPEPNEKLEVVFSTSDDSEALVVRGLLASNGIEVNMSTPESPVSVFPVAQGDLGEVQLWVRTEHAEEARRLIEDSERGGPEAAEEAEREEQA